MSHLHLIREIEPEKKPHYQRIKVYCPYCQEYIYIIHLELPPENPKEIKKQ